MNEESKPADVIIVLSDDQGRVEEAVRLCQLGYANRLLFTAVGSEKMARRAESLGVAEDHILVEEKAWSTSTEARYSSAVMRARGFRSAIVVTSAYHTRRARIIFGRFFREWSLTICAVPFDSSTPHNWWKNRDTATSVISEYIKLAMHYIMPDWL